MSALVSLAGPEVTLDPASLASKERALLELLSGLRRLVVAYSGGTDSAYLAWAAHRALGGDMVAVTADSASLPASHKRDAEAFAREWGIPHECLRTAEFDNPDYVKNDKDRCFHCKDELFVQLKAFATERGYDHIAYGINMDDLGDYRPGQRAAKLHGVESPLTDVGLTKREIRALSQQAGLATWDRPAAPCLSSRVPYGTAVTIETVRTIEQGEEAIKALGFRQFRVRFHGELVRLEISRDELPRALTAEMASAFTRIFKGLGFLYVTLDLEGYRQGALNEVLRERLG